MLLPNGQEPYNIIEVRFKGSRKEFYRNKENLPLQVGELIAVEANPGHDIGIVSMVGELVRFQLKKKNVKEDSEEIRLVYRKAKPTDVEKWEAAKALESSTMHRARAIAIHLNLSMKLSDVEYQGDMKKATFFYTADERVDFRELIKKLAEEFKTRIEMRQIGMRQEASRLGGIGSCGRELCCSTWLTDFRSVSTSAARYQNLSLNPLKLAGQCGKLKCCLNYELDSYMDALREFPDINIVLQTGKGNAYHRKTDIFKRLMWYSHSAREDFSEGGDGNWVALPTTRVKEIIEMNKKKVTPPDLLSEKIVITKSLLDYHDVVGQDSLTRMDKENRKSRPKHKKRKKPQGSQSNDSPKK